MYWPSQRQRESAVNHYWNSVVEGAPSAPAGLDRGLAGLIDAVAASDASPKPERAFVDRLEAHLMGQAVWKSPVPQPDYLPGTENVSSSRSVANDSRRFRLPGSGERSRLKAGLSWFSAQAAFVVLLILIAGGIASIYLLGNDGEEGEREIPAVVDSTDRATPVDEDVMSTLAAADIDPEVMFPGGPEGWTEAHFLLVELRPGETNLITFCEGCQTPALMMVMEGQVDLSINGPVYRVAERGEARTPEKTEGKQLIQLHAGDAVIFDIHIDSATERIVNTSNANAQYLLGALPRNPCVQVTFANLPKLFTISRPLPPMTDAPLGLTIEEITIDPHSRFAFEITDGRQELYLLSSGALTAVTAEGQEPGNRLTSSWRVPTGMQVDRYPAGSYFFQNDAEEPAKLYRLSVAYDPVSDPATIESPAMPEACPTLPMIFDG
jgi:hypothetical protein